MSGQGVDPVTKITPTEGPIDWSYVMVEDTVIRNLKIENSSNLSVRFSLRTENESIQKYNFDDTYFNHQAHQILMVNHSLHVFHILELYYQVYNSTGICNYTLIV